MISITDFEKCVDENIETLNREMAEKSFTPSNYHFYEKYKHQEKRLFEFENAWDIIGATIIGDLPSNKPNGEDGYRLIDNELIPVEYKISRKYRSSIWQTPNEALKLGKSNTVRDKKSLRSAFVASYEIKNNLETKDRLTVLYVYDETLQQFVSGFELDGSKVIEYLDNGSMSSKRKITLSYFRNNGIEIDLKISNVYGGSYLDWEDDLKNSVKTLYPGDKLTSY